MTTAMKLNRLPLVVILGSTGTGKSKLGIEIGKRIGGEILSADSMQVYNGLDIVTNKVTAEELLQCPHHLLDFVSPLKEFSVVEFRNMALPLIEDIKKRGKVPIVVGGTNYYIESILWDILIDDRDNNTGSGLHQEQGFFEPSRAIKRRKKIENTAAAVSDEGSEVAAVADSNESTEKSCGELDTTENGRERSLYERLREVDPIMADRLHPNDSRKIARSIQVFEEQGIQHSKILEEQQRKQGGSAYGGPQRYGNTCVFWLQCQREILNDRLDKRVDVMLERGLVNELLDFHREYNMERNTKDPGSLYTEGIFQSIGFKEFHEFLVNQNGKVFDGSTATAEEKLLLNRCVEKLKIAGRRYAKKQITWVKNRFLGRPCSSAPSVYGLDVTNLDNWENDVLEKALDILLKLMNGEKPAFEPLPRLVGNQADKHSRHICEICDSLVILGEDNWQKHLTSKSHKWHVKKDQRIKNSVRKD